VAFLFVTKLFTLLVCLLPCFCCVQWIEEQDSCHRIW
jgi:hypothetical protein